MRQCLTIRSMGVPPLASGGAWARRPCYVGAPLFTLCLLFGCASAVERGFNPALDHYDLEEMTDDMAMQITASPAVQEAIEQDGALRVVVLPVENYMQGEVLPRGPAEAFTARVRALLSRHAPDRFTWVMNRDAYHRLRRQELDVDLGPPPEAINPQYALVARFHSLAEVDRRRRDVYYLCVYELTDIEQRTVLWTGTYEVRKVAVKGFMD